MARQKVRRLKMALEDKFTEAAVILQKNFRMWKAQSLYVGMQLQATNSDMQRISFIQQVFFIVLVVDIEFSFFFSLYYTQI